jgi:alkaline phosphatase D
MAITLRPIIGHTTDTTVKIWLRGEAGINHDKKEYCYGVVDIYEDSTIVASKFCYLKDYYDFTGVVRFDGLKPKTLYTVQCDTRYYIDDKAPIIDTLVAGPLATGANAVSSKFKTSGTSTDGKINFVFGSCRYLYWDNFLHSDAEKGDKTFRSILSIHDESPLDLVLMIGDQVYADPLNILHSYETVEELFTAYRKSFNLPNISKLMSQVPTYMVLDDHEIKNNWSKDQIRNGNQGTYVQAMRAYTSYQHLHNPDTPDGQYWYAFQQGVFPFFVMDTRTQRIVEGSSIEPKSMLGREQLNSFLDWLHENRKAPMKFVISSVPFFPDPKKGEGDKWAGFPEERSIILEFIRLEKIRNVVILSGDVHNTSFARMKCYQDLSFGLTSLVSSPFYWPYPHESSSDFYGGRTIEYMQWADSGRRVRDRIEYRYEGEGFIGDESFALVSVDLEAGNKPGRAKIFDRKGSSFPEYPNEFIF